VAPGSRLELSARGLPAPAEGALRLEGTLSARTGPRHLALSLPADAEGRRARLAALGRELAL
jgi:hypothetical protein